MSEKKTEIQFHSPFEVKLVEDEIFLSALLIVCAFGRISWFWFWGYLLLMVFNSYRKQNEKGGE